MPKGPNGQKRPADAVGAAIMVAKIATCEIEETKIKNDKIYTQKAGLVGAKNRAANLTDEQRSEIARIAASARWKKKS